jgi:hypothetical protein
MEFQSISALNSSSEAGLGQNLLLIVIDVVVSSYISSDPVILAPRPLVVSRAQFQTSQTLVSIQAKRPPQSGFVH